MTKLRWTRTESGYYRHGRFTVGKETVSAYSKRKGGHFVTMWAVYEGEGLLLHAKTKKLGQKHVVDLIELEKSGRET